MANLNDLTSLFETVDSRTAFIDRVGEISAWIETLPGAQAAALVCTDQLNLGPGDQVVPRISASKIPLLPAEPAVLNGKSPLPAGVFPESSYEPVTVYAPFRDPAGTVLGALLIKSTDAKHFLKRFHPVLRILSSKTRDLVEIATHRSSAAASGALGPGDLTPLALGKLMDLFNLPLYVAGPDGRFESVNRRFLDVFRYESLGDLQSRGEVFIRQDDWAVHLQRVTSEAVVHPGTVRIRTGDNRILTAQDHSALIGRSVVGVLVDVSDYVGANERLTETLEAQRDLNDRLSSATAMLQKTQATAIKSLAKLAEYRDKETGGHLQRICEYMRIVTREIHNDQPYPFHVSEEYPEDIYLSGMLHDIGKVAVPDQILLKAGPLDDGEWSIMKKHTNWGHLIIDQADNELGQQSYLTLASRIALHHHEWWDGSGYPYGLSRDEIPLSARIGAVADVYDALTSRRPYKEAWDHVQAVDEIQRLSGKQFDPVIGDIFTRLEHQFEAIRSRFPDEPTLLN